MPMAEQELAKIVGRGHREANNPLSLREKASPSYAAYDVGQL
jgi:hypothetical protein